MYFDNSTTSYPKPQEVYDAISDYGKHIGVSPSRSMYKLARSSNKIIDYTREKLANLFNITNSSNICFTPNATYSANIAIKGLLKQGDHVIITNFEHNALYRPVVALASAKNVSYSIFKSNKEGIFDLNNLQNLIKTNTKLIICNHASNVIGVVSPIMQIGTLAKKNKIPFLVDCSQSAGLINIDVQKNNIEILLGTGHKSLLGPPGIGFLYIRNDNLINTIIEGGTGHNSLSPKHPKNMPDKLEAGTLNYLGIAGLSASLDYIIKEKIDNILNHELELTEFLLNKLQKFPFIKIYGTKNINVKVPIVSFNIDNFPSSYVAKMLDEHNIYVRPGLHCAPLIHKTLGTINQGTIRLSFGYKNNRNEIEKFLYIITDIYKNLTKLSF